MSVPNENPTIHLSALETLEAGKPYLPTDPELQMLRERAYRHAQAFAESSPGQHVQHLRLLTLLFGRLGGNPQVERPLHVEYGRHVIAGDHLVIGTGCVFIDAGTITLGDDVHIGPGVHFYASTRPLKAEQRINGYEQAVPITIGNRVWIGGGSIINGGVTIGENTVIAPGSVVLQDIPANVYAAGNPCRIIRELGVGS